MIVERKNSISQDLLFFVLGHFSFLKFYLFINPTSNFAFISNLVKYSIKIPDRTSPQIPNRSSHT